MTRRSLAALAAAVVTGTLLAVPAPASADHLAKANGTAGEVPNRSLPMLTGRGAAHGPGPHVVRAELVEELSDLPGPLRRHLRVSPVKNRSFTITAVGEQACVSWRPGARRGTVAPGPCAHTARAVTYTPLTDTADLLNGMAARTIRFADPDAVEQLVNAADLGEIAGVLAPRGVRVHGVTDRNHDNLDDDGRVTFSAGGRSVCAQLPIRSAEKPRMFYADCATLPARDTGSISDFGWEPHVEATAGQVAASITGLSVTRQVTVDKLTTAAIRRAVGLLPHGYRLTRTGKLTFKVSSHRQCSTTITFTTTLGQRAHVRDAGCN